MAGWSLDNKHDIPIDVFRPATERAESRIIVFLRDEDGALPEALKHPDTIAKLHDRQLTVLAPNGGPLWAWDVALPGKAPDDTPRRVWLDHVLPQVDALAGSSSTPRALFGAGMGGQAALRLAYDYPQRFPVVVAVEPKIDFHLYVRYGHPLLEQMFAEDELARQHTAILHVHPLNWPRKHFFCCDPASEWFEGVDRLRMKLAASGVPFECDLETTCNGDLHQYFCQQMDRVLDFLVRGLDSERLRVV